jgi:hypothetical protein
MRNVFLSAALLCAAAAAPLAASSVCPSTPQTTSDCDFLITVASNGSVSVATVPGSTPFNAPLTLPDGTMEPGGDASLVGVVNNYSRALTSLTLQGVGTEFGVFDFQFNGICVYTNAPYCATAASGYEGPTTTFANLKIGSDFKTGMGTVMFNPSLMMGSSTYFSLMESGADINANGGLTVVGETFAGTAAAPEPAQVGTLVLGLLIALFAVRRRSRLA